MRCAIAESCTGIDCCVGAAPVHHNFHAYLDVDPCSLQMKFGIDKFQFQIYLREFEFGIEKDVRLVNVVRMKYVVIYMDVQEKLKVFNFSWFLY